jgi:hypothetical protein
LQKSEEEEEFERDVEKCESGEVGSDPENEMEEDPDYEKDLDAFQRNGNYEKDLAENANGYHVNPMMFEEEADFHVEQMRMLNEECYCMMCSAVGSRCHYWDHDDC